MVRTREMTMPDSEPVTINGKPVQCAHCNNAEFLTRNALLNTRLMTYLNLDWLNKSARVHVCAACGHLEWFLALDPPYPEPDETYDITCFDCGATIPAGQSVCTNCGWTYKGEDA